MSVLQSLRQQSVRDVTGTAYTYEGDWHALFDADGIADGTFNERLLAWINVRLSASYTDLPAAMQALAVDQGFANWASMGTFTVSSGPTLTLSSEPVMWLKASTSTYQSSDGTTAAGIGDPVGYWGDQSASGNHPIQATAASRPTVRLDERGQRYVEFDNSDDWLLTDNTVAYKGVAIYGRFRGDSGTAAGTLVGSAEADNRYALNKSSTTQMFIANSQGFLNFVPPSTGQTNAHVIQFTNPADAYIDGVEKNLDNNAANRNLGLNGRVYIGRRNNATPVSSAIDVYEVILSTNAFTADDLTALQTYFAARYESPLADFGTWTWFNTPVAVRYQGTTDKTYFGVVDAGGSVRVGAYDHDNDKYLGSTLLKSALQVDDHINPALLVRTDGKLLAVYTKHNGPMYSRISTNAEDHTAWGVEATIDASLDLSYAVLENLSSETNTIHLFYRQAVPGPWKRRKSTDSGATWSAASTVIENTGQRPYMRACGDGTSKIHFAFGDGHPGEVTGNSLYHCYYDGGNWYKSDGTLIGADADLPVTPADATKVYNTLTSGKSWVWDIKLDASGNPIIVFAVFVDAASDHRYWYAKWTGSAWQTGEVCSAGGPLYAAQTYYSGGIAIYDENTLYAVRDVSGDWGLYKYTTTDGGSTWSGTLIQSDATDTIMRPNVPRGTPNAGLKVMYSKGTYTAYTSFTMRPRRSGT